MPLPSGAHVRIGESEFLLDESYEERTGRRCYLHGGRSLFADQLNITGAPGSRNLRQDVMTWIQSNFSGEGQVVLDNDDPSSARRFLFSEGLDFRTPGEFKLNRSSLAQTPAVAGAATTTFEGAADFTNVVGTSTTSGTDRRITLINDQVGTNANHTPGASAVQVDFFLYREGSADNDTEIAGSALKLDRGDGQVIGADFSLRSGAVRTTKLVTGTHFTAAEVQRVEFFLHWSIFLGFGFIGDTIVSILDVTNGINNAQVVASRSVRFTHVVEPSTPTATLSFTPSAGRSYDFRVRQTPAGPGASASLLIDFIKYGPEVSSVNTAVIEVFNQTGSVTVQTRTISITATAAGNKVGSIVFSAAAVTNYRYRVKRASGSQRIWVDKVAASIQATTVYTMNCVELGLDGIVYLAASQAAADGKAWVYDPTNDDWDEEGTFNDAAATTAAVTRAMAHSDSLQYFLLSNDEVYTLTAAGVDDRYAHFSANGRDLVGMCIAQNRVFLMAEDASGVRIYSLPLDGTATPYDLNSASFTTAGQFVDIPAGSKSPDTGARQRMTGSNSGARFFLNYGDATVKLFEVDSSGSVLQPRELPSLDNAMKATAIAYSGGLTFIAGQYQAESDQTAQSVLWYIDANGIPERVGFFRFTSPTAAAPVSMVAYQTDLYILQGARVWRFDTVEGGLYLEYELSPPTPANARAFAVTQGRTFAQYDEEVWVTGSEATYRQAGAAGANKHTSSVYDYGLPGTDKALTSIQVLTDELDPALQQVSVEYQADSDGTWVQLGTTGRGARHSFTPSEATTFTSIQTRLSPASLTGTVTPTVRGIITKAVASERDEYFDLVLRCSDAVEDQEIAGDTQTGAQKAAALVGLWRAGTPVSFADGYSGSGGDYRVTIEDIRVEFIQPDEGRAVVTLRVL